LKTGSGRAVMALIAPRLVGLAFAVARDVRVVCGADPIQCM